MTMPQLDRHTDVPTSTTVPSRSDTTTTTETSSSSTRVRAYACARDLAAETLLQMNLESIRTDFLDIMGRPLPRFTERQLQQDLQENDTPAIYYRYALREAASAPMPSWRYVLAIVARLKRQQVPEDDLLWWF